MGWSLFRKLLPYLLIIALGFVLYGGFRYYANKVETLTTEKTHLQTQLSQVNTNYNTLQNMYSISMKQVEELQKQQTESLKYVEELRQSLNEIDLKKSYDEDSAKLLNDINNYEKCMVKNFKNPYKQCYKNKENGE